MVPNLLILLRFRFLSHFHFVNLRSKIFSFLQLPIKNSTFKLLFFLRKPKDYKSGPQLIYLRITIDGTRCEISVQRDCDPPLWDDKLGRQHGTKEPARMLSTYLDSLVAKVYECQNELLRKGVPVNADSIKNRYTGIDKQARMLVPISKSTMRKWKHLSQAVILGPAHSRDIRPVYPRRSNF